MIRSFEKEDLCEVLQLWLSVNLEVHSFVKRKLIGLSIGIRWQR